jgi:hypothetical protein
MLLYLANGTSARRSVVREKPPEQGRASTAQPKWQIGEEPKARDRHRAFQSPQGGRKSPKEKVKQMGGRWPGYALRPERRGSQLQTGAPLTAGLPATAPFRPYPP